ncbi:hypothetical protein DFJ77DRAFT_200116 [Powellomyces hirtus]|nr:hypothetical protein DFJ77DRAFT_200116 [Powellomyces hirtus]
MSARSSPGSLHQPQKTMSSETAAHTVDTTKKTEGGGGTTSNTLISTYISSLTSASILASARRPQLVWEKNAARTLAEKHRLAKKIQHKEKEGQFVAAQIIEKGKEIVRLEQKVGECRQRRGATEAVLKDLFKLHHELTQIRSAFYEHSINANNDLSSLSSLSSFAGRYSSSRASIPEPTTTTTATNSNYKHHPVATAFKRGLHLNLRSGMMAPQGGHPQQPQRSSPLAPLMMQRSSSSLCADEDDRSNNAGLGGETPPEREKHITVQQSVVAGRGKMSNSMHMGTLPKVAEAVGGLAGGQQTGGSSTGDAGRSNGRSTPEFGSSFLFVVEAPT